MRILIGLLGCSLAVAACQKDRSKLDDRFQPTTVVDPPGGPPPAATAAHATAPAAAADSLSGTVVETIPASTYTYARLDHDGKELWLAGPETKLAIGAKVGPLTGTLMQDFHSDTLKRTFSEIYFVNSFGQPVPESHATAPAASAASAPAGELGGTVVTTMDSGGYTYAQVTDAAGTKTWLAGPTAKLAVGTKLAGLGGTLMTAFHSSTLNRTFDQIYFVTAWGTSAVAAPTPPVAAAGSAAEPVEKVARAPNGKTVAEIIAGRAGLEGKTVDVRGKVVKVTTGVLDRNWAHLRDGSGSAGSNDLMITTKEDLKVGEIVTAHGTVGTNRDLGAGYHYDVLVENATLAR